MPHRAVFFDLGGTLFSYHDVVAHMDRSLERFARRRGMDAPLAELRRHYQTAVARVLESYSERSFYLHRQLFSEAYLGFLAALGVAHDSEDADLLPIGDKVLGAAGLRARAGARETLAALNARGLHLAVVSNIDDDQFAAVWPQMELDPFVAAVTTSEEARSCKPDPGIFRIALAKAGNPAPETVVFVGDSILHDVAGANALGMTSVLIGPRPSPAHALHTPHHVIGDLRELLGIVQG